MNERLERRAIERTWFRPPKRTPRVQRRRFAAVIAAVAIAITPTVTIPLATPPAQAAAGVSEAPTVVFTENFENNMTNTAIGAKSYTTANGSLPYVGASGQTYTGSPQWINGERCNGVVLSYNNSAAPAWASTPLLANKCSLATGVQSYNGIRTLARAMGQYSGMGDNEHIVSGYTECQLVTSTGNTGTCDTIGSGATNGVMFQTTSLVPVTPNHYYTFSVDTVYGNCANPASTTTQASDPQYQFQLVDGAGTATNVGGVLNGCRPSPNRQTYVVNRPAAVGASTTMTAYVQSLRATSAFQYTGSSLGIKMFNASGVTNGNDGGFDNIRVLDVTPSLDKAFSPTVITRGGTSTATFTITNTTDLLAKTDWSFTDALPANLVVAAVPNIGGTCTQLAGAALVRTATAGSSTIAVTGGDLAAGMTSCTVTVAVTSAIDGAYVNGPANITTNLIPPDNASLEVIKPSIDIVKVANKTNLLVGDTVTYTFTATNTTPKVASSTVANTSLSNVTITEDSFTGAGAMSPLTCDRPAPVTLASGQVVTCTATYVVQQADLDSALLSNVARATGTPVVGPVVTDTDDEKIPGAQSPALTLEKSAAVTDVDQDGVTGLGDHILYSFDVTNSGNVTVANIAVIDDLLTQFAITVTCTPTTIAPTQVAHCTANAPYVVIQDDVDAHEVVNTAHATGTTPAGGPVQSNDDSTLTPIDRFRIPLQIEKVGETIDATWVRMDGSSFALHTDDNGQLGAPVVLPITEIETGLFQIDAIPAGTYWLTEVTAPDGFNLLAQPVKFTINPDRTVSILTNAGGAVSADGQLITLRDVPALEMPVTGGTGNLPYLITGTALIILATGLIVFVRRRRRNTPTDFD